MKIEVVERDVTGMGHRKYDGKGDGNVTLIHPLKPDVH